MPHNRIFIIGDDHAIVRDGIASRLRKMFTGCTIYEASNLDEVLKLVKSYPADLLMLDINMPGGNSTRMLDSIFLNNAHVKVLIISALSEELYGLRYLKNGAHGYMNKTAPGEALEKAVHTILDNKKYTSDNINNLMLDKLLNKQLQQDSGLELLSDREIEVADMLVKGKGLLEISNTLHISTSTVNTYKSRIFKKTNVSNIVDLLEKMRMHHPA